jgi:hypothetical protein
MVFAISNHQGQAKRWGNSLKAGISCVSLSPHLHPKGLVIIHTFAPPPSVFLKRGLTFFFVFDTDLIMDHLPKLSQVTFKVP